MDNQRNVVLYIAASLDGYIARDDHSLDWLFKTEGEGDNGYSEFYETVDTILIGRKTYDQVMILENGEFPYKNKQCYVFSSSLTGRNENVHFVNEDVAKFTKQLKEEPGERIWLVGGGELFHSFLKEKLVDEIILTIAPAIIGKGIPLFKADNIDVELELKDITRFNQFAQLHYDVKK
jgi:dihydrofolate reductase